MLTKPLTGASINAIILAILNQGDNYGWAIIKRVRDLSKGEVEWAAGSLYPIMHKMKANGWVNDYWVDNGVERRRKYYKITRAGQKALAAEKAKWMLVHGMLEILWKDSEATPAIA